MIHELRDYQKDSVEALRENIRNGIRRQVLCSPTGSGKTEIAMYIVEEAARKGSRVYFVCDRQTLVEQTSERFTENDIEHGVLMGQRSRRLWSNILVCSSQTLESRGFSWKRTKWEWEDEQETARPPDLLIIDECHEIRKKIVGYIVEKDVLTIGLSATPFTKGLKKYYDAVVNVTTTQELVTQEFLSPLRIVASHHSRKNGPERQPFGNLQGLLPFVHLKDYPLHLSTKYKANRREVSGNRTLCACSKRMHHCQV